MLNDIEAIGKKVYGIDQENGRDDFISLYTSFLWDYSKSIKGMNIITRDLII